MTGLCGIIFSLSGDDFGLVFFQREKFLNFVCYALHSYYALLKWSGYFTWFAFRHDKFY